MTIELGSAVKAFEDDAKRRQQEDETRLTLSLGRLAKTGERVVNDEKLPVRTREERLRAASDALQGRRGNSNVRGLPASGSDDAPLTDQATPEDIENALRIAKSITEAGTGATNAMALIVNGQMKVKDDGTPEEVDRLRKQVKTAEDERDKSDQLLAELTRHVGLIGQKVLGRKLGATEDIKDYLKEVENKAGTGSAPAGGLNKPTTDTVKNNVSTAIAALKKSHDARIGGGTVTPQAEFDNAMTALKNAARELGLSTS